MNQVMIAKLLSKGIIMSKSDILEVFGLTNAHFTDLVRIKRFVHCEGNYWFIPKNRQDAMKERYCSMRGYDKNAPKGEIPKHQERLNE